MAEKFLKSLSLFTNHHIVTFLINISTRASKLGYLAFIIFYLLESWREVNLLNIQLPFFWDVTRRKFLHCYWRFGTIYRDHFQGFSCTAWPLKVERIDCTKRLHPTNQLHTAITQNSVDVIYTAAEARNLSYYVIIRYFHENNIVKLMLLPVDQVKSSECLKKTDSLL
jgi:hypothetical protein